MKNNQSAKLIHEIYGALGISKFDNRVENALIVKRFLDLSNYMGFSDADGLEILGIVSHMFTNSTDITYIENTLKEAFLKKRNLSPQCNENIDRRADKIVQQIRQWLYGKRILDVGSGDGLVAWKIHQSTTRQVFQIDVLDYVIDINDLPFFLYNGQDLPFADNAFDSSLLLTVLHHTDEPESLLRETLRVTRKRLIVIETVHHDEQERRANLFFDWLCNSILTNVNLPFNLKSDEEWKEMFNTGDAEVIYDEDLGIDLPFVPESHYLYIINKK